MIVTWSIAVILCAFSMGVISTVRKPFRHSPVPLWIRVRGIVHELESSGAGDSENPNHDVYVMARDAGRVLDKKREVDAVSRLCANVSLADTEKLLESNRERITAEAFVLDSHMEFFNERRRAVGNAGLAGDMGEGR